MNNTTGSAQLKDSFYVVSKYASGVTAKWMYSPGDLSQPEKVEDYFCWEKQTSISTLPIDFDEDSSIMSEDEFAEDVVEDVTTKTNHGISPPPPPPSYNSKLQSRYKEFKEMSLVSQSREPRRRLSCGVSPVILTNSAGRRTSRKKLNQRLTQSEHNRSKIHDSMKSLLGDL